MVLDISNISYLLVILGIILIFLGIALKIKKDSENFAPLLSFSREMAVLGILFISFGLLLSILVPIVPEPSVFPVAVSITDPSDGATVPYSLIVNGTISGNLSNNLYMWVLIHPQGSRGWWPQDRVKFFDGKWQVYAWIGTQESVEMCRKYDISVVVVNGQTNTYYLDYIKEGIKIGEYPEIPLPDDARIYDLITVSSPCVIYWDDVSDVTNHNIRLVEVKATSESSPPKLNDRITIEFTLQNVGNKPITFVSTFIAARNPSGENEDIGYGNAGRTIQPQEIIRTKGSIIVDSKGVWKFGPAYSLKLPDGTTEGNPNEWRRFPILVE